MTTLKFMTFILFMAAATLTLSACENTWRGAGQDIEETGAEMSDSYDGDNW
jgi:predicted small secreted protein